jgi:cysteine desulfurase / selenocysteine lyase
MSAYPVERIRAEFPVLQQQIDGKPFAFRDSTATTQKPLAVIDAMDHFYREHYSSVKRGVYRLSEKTTLAFEATRRKVAQFIGAESENSIVFTRGTTESINLVAWSWGRKFLHQGDEIVISALEHHANIVPWQLIAEERGAVLKVIPCNDQGDLILEALPGLLGARTRIVSITHIANSIGTVNPVAAIARLVRQLAPQARFMVDAAQSVPHLPLDVKHLDCDFLAFSGHKMYGPTGIGVLYGRPEVLESMPPWHGGGEMIDRVTFERTTYAPPPARFEAGTPPIAEVIGLGAAIDWINGIGLSSIHAHENSILAYAEERLRTVPGLHIVASPKERGSLLSLTLDCAHPHDAAMILDEEGVAVRSGHHCAQPVMDRFGLPATLRASFGAYTTPWEIDRLELALRRVVSIFA